MVGGHLRPDGAVEFVAGLAQQHEGLTRIAAQAGRDAPGDVVDHAKHSDHRRGKNRHRPGLVVKADVAAGDRNAQRRTAIRLATHRLRELPHHPGVFG